jgi:trehalose synthase-fused probable maltokinase
MPDGAGGRRRPTWVVEVRVDGHPGPLVDALENDVLPRVLAGARWYGAKDAGPPHVRILDLIGFGPDGDVAVALLSATPPGRSAQTWVLPLAVEWGPAGQDPSVAAVTDGRRTGRLADAVASGAFARAFLATAARETADGLALRRTGAPLDMAALAAAPVAVSGAEQSNSSIRFGDIAILKLFRRLEPGVHPEIEIGRFLTETAGFDGAPPLLGWLELGGAEPVVAGSLVAVVAGARDGWATATDLLRGPAGGPALAGLARTLGRRTAAMHRAFAVPTGDPAFRADAATAADLDAMASAAQADAGRVLDALAARTDPDARRLVRRRDDLLAALGAVRSRGGGAVRTRVHGDYHLGQVLVAAGGDVRIVDFEGEPMRPLAERRAKRIPLTDVAGMLRSFAYAAAAAGRDDDAGAAAAFLDAYRAEAGAAVDDALLRFFVLERAVYEVGYEIANRPDWVSIPVRGILALLGAAGGGDRGGARRGLHAGGHRPRGDRPPRPPRADGDHGGAADARRGRPGRAEPGQRRGRPLRTGREPSRHGRPALHRAAPHALGCRDRPRRSAGRDLLTVRAAANPP